MPFTVRNLVLSPAQPLSQTLGHKPFYAIPYENFDGIYALKTDAIYLSVGIAQYDQSSVSVKSMRISNNQWSPQSEELPVHRVIDMSILVAKSLFDAQNGSVDFATGVFQGQDSAMTITQEPQRTSAEKNSFDNFKIRNGQLVRDRLNSLADVLNDLRRRGCI